MSALGCALALATGPKPVAADPPRHLPGAAPAVVRLMLTPLPDMPPVSDPDNLYGDTATGHMSPVTAGMLPRVYVPEHGSDSVSVIDPATLKVVDHFRVGNSPQHIVPSWDLKTLWVTNNADTGGGASLTPIDPFTGKPGKPVIVHDPYNMYFTPDGKAAIIVREAQRQLEFRDPHTMAPLYSIPTPDCIGINHADFSIDGRYVIFSCEFVGAVTKIDLVERRVVATLKLSKPGAMAMMAEVAPPERTVRVRRGRRGHRFYRTITVRGGRGHGGMHHNMPQDVRVSPDGKVFYVADMISDGVFMIDGETLTQIGFIPTGPGAHGFCVSRDAKRLYVSNRGSHAMPSGSPGGKGSVTVIDFATRSIVANWPIPGGGSPDMGGVSADGKTLWFAGRFDNVVYAIDTGTGDVTQIKVGSEPHGLSVWPQPGRYSLGHTGNMR
jgi:YVTN family beta-propeller protein